MELKPGYKKTDVGIIPVDWDHASIADVADIRVARDLMEDRFSPICTSVFKYPVYSNTVASDGLYGYYSIPEFEGEHLTVVGRGVGLGTAFAKSGGFGAIGRLLVLLPNDRADARYLATYINQRVVIFVETGGIPQLTGVQFSKYKVAIPPIHEQREIASALGDVDASLGALDRLIAKKRDLKQAAMQQLLTGQIRLPGFHGEWETRRLGEHVNFLKNGVFSRAELIVGGAVSYLHYGDIHTSDAVRLNAKMTPMPSLSAHHARLLDRLKDGDLVFVDASEDLDGVGKSVEILGASDTQLVAGLHTIAARFDKSILTDGFKAYLQFCPPFRDHLKRLAAGTKVYATNRTHIATAELRLPNSEEQVAIATVLEDMDTEISLLEGRREKTRALKQGMMQELLTGRTRLVSQGGTRA